MGRRDGWTPGKVAAELSGPGGVREAVEGAARVLGGLSGRLEGEDREAARRAAWELRGALGTMRAMAAAFGGFGAPGGRGGCKPRGSTRCGYDCPEGGE